jgi:hypothetical protein
MRISLFLVLVVLVAVGAACDGSDTETTVRTPSGDNDAPRINTGISDLDYTVNAALRVDTLELAGLTGYQHIPCVAESQGAASPPVCRENEELGMEVEGFPVLQCELVWLRPEMMADTYGQALGESPRLVTIYRPADRDLVLDSEYVAVFDTDPGDANAGIALSIDAGRSIQIEYDCNNFAGLYSDDKVDEFVVAPTAEATPEATAQ